MVKVKKAMLIILWFALLLFFVFGTRMILATITGGHYPWYLF